MPENYSHPDHISHDVNSIVFNPGHTEKLSQKLFAALIPPEDNQVLIQAGNENPTVFSRYLVTQLVEFSQTPEKMVAILDYLVQELRQFPDPNEDLQTLEQAVTRPDLKNSVEIWFDNTVKTLNKMIQVFQAIRAYAAQISNLAENSQNQILLRHWTNLAAELQRIEKYLQTDYIPRLQAIESQLNQD